SPRIYPTLLTSLCVQSRKVLKQSCYDSLGKAARFWSARIFEVGVTAKSMKKALQALLFLAFLVTPSIAQKMDQFQLFGGYSYMRANVREYFRSTPDMYSINNRYTNLNGWNVSLTENLNHWFGGTLDGSGLYGSPTLSGTSTSQHAYSLLYGPRFFHQGRKITPFGHVLGGATHISATVSTGPHV